jgi:hypothetical protein
MGPSIDGFAERMRRYESESVPVVVLCKERKPFKISEFPFASLSVLVVLVSLFALSMHLGGWSWSSWTYAFSIAIALPLVAIEMKRKAIITGGALILLVATVVIDAGLPQYFGYSPSHLSWYDLTAHFLGALLLTVFLWTFVCWALSPTGPPRENGRRKFISVVLTVAIVSLLFELTEFMTDVMFGWTNFHPGIDTAGDIIFDMAGLATGAFLIWRHRLSAVKRPFWITESTSGA